MSYGIEREALIFDDSLKPINFKEEEIECCVTLDFADNQLEIVSPTFDKIETCYNFINQKVINIDKENNYIWPYSFVGNFKFEPSISGFKDENKRLYRNNLKNKYNSSLLLTSGIHINYNNDQISDSNYYFELMQKIYMYAPLIIKLFGYTPFVDNVDLQNDLNKINYNYGFKDSLSLRNSYKYGYRNENKFEINYDDINSYRDSINEIFVNNLLTNEKELYSLVKLKPSINNVKYIELRMFDINPFYKSGLNKKYLFLLDKIIKYLDNITINDFNIDEVLNNIELVSLHGNDNSIILTINGINDSLENHFNILLKEVDEQFINLDTLESSKLYNILLDNNITKYFTTKMFDKDKFIIDNKYKDLELSTTLLIKEALKHNLKVEIINRNKNVIKIENEIIFQSTKTSLDNYVSVLLMEDKLLTKYMLDKENINTPQSETYNNNVDEIFNKFKDTKIVIKPTDTNFGQGISIIDCDAIDKLQQSINYASKYSSNVIVEQFIEGEEYRFLVINHEVVSVIKRDGANVIGNGKQSIKELIEIKNSSSLRGNDYSYPLFKIKVDEVVISTLKEQNIDLNYIPDVNEKIYLRYNSNISTGGDSIEVSEVINDYYKNVAMEASKTLNAAICGIDMIIIDKYSNNYTYSIIEANFNPAIHMHTYPLYGKGKNVSKYILKVLNLL